jgi:hypothetical protein
MVDEKKGPIVARARGKLLPLIVEGDRRFVMIIHQKIELDATLLKRLPDSPEGNEVYSYPDVI